MNIRKLHLKNIGVFDDEEIEFKECPAKDKAEIHILTGENGTGKTTILMALASFFDYFENDKLRPLSNNFHKRFKQSKYDSFALVESNTPSDFKKIQLDTYAGLVKETAFAIGVKNFCNHKAYGEWVIEEKSPTVTGEYFKGITFATFAFSSYRQIEDERVQANYLPKDFNPLSQSLKFIKDYRKEGEITINQLVANNISNRALSKEDGSLEEAKKYETVINSIETFIKDVTDYEVKFVLKRSPNELKLKIHSEELDFDVLPDGLRSLISWIADLLGRVDLLKWQDDLPITEKNLILLLDEIEVHLHPAWQRKVLPVVQKLFKNAQIFVSTHSPFVVNSVDDAWVYKLKVEDGKARVEEVVESENSNTITQVLREVFDIEQLFGLEVQNNFEEFKKLKNKIISNGADKSTEDKLLEKARSLADEPNDQLKQLVRKELEELSAIKKKPYKL
jgi:predicted ATP-binding protein involved in virulence